MSAYVADSCCVRWKVEQEALQMTKRMLLPQPDPLSWAFNKGRRRCCPWLPSPSPTDVVGMDARRSWGRICSEPEARCRRHPDLTASTWILAATRVFLGQLQWQRHGGLDREGRDRGQRISGGSGRYSPSPGLGVTAISSSRRSPLQWDARLARCTRRRRRRGATWRERRDISCGEI
jgi:hypothetical protein